LLETASDSRFARQVGFGTRLPPAVNRVNSQVRLPNPYRQAQGGRLRTVLSRLFFLKRPISVWCFASTKPAIPLR